MVNVPEKPVSANRDGKVAYVYVDVNRIHSDPLKRGF
jgi:hypothetical protein